MSNETKQERYLKRQRKSGVVQIRVMVPEDGVEKIRNMAAKMRAKHKKETS